MAKRISWKTNYQQLHKEQQALSLFAARLDQALLREKMKTGPAPEPPPEPEGPVFAAAVAFAANDALAANVAFAAPAGAGGAGAEAEAGPEVYLNINVAGLGYWQRLSLLCLHSLATGIALTDPTQQSLSLSDPQELGTYVRSEEQRFREMALQAAAYQALRTAAQEISDAHRNAAKVIVDGPNEATTGALQANLRTLSEYIRGDQNLTTTLNILETVAVAYGG